MAKTVWTSAVKKGGRMLLCLAGCMGCCAAEFSMQFSFGPYAEGDDGPAHQEGVLGEEDLIWNTGVNATGLVTVVNTRGEVLDGVEVQLGAGPPGGSIQFGLPLLAHSCAYQPGNEYANELWGHWLFTVRKRELALSIRGLPRQRYAVFALVREGDELARTYEVGIGLLNEASYAGGVLFDMSQLDHFKGKAASVNYQYDLNEDYFKTQIRVRSRNDRLIIIIRPKNGDYGTLQGLQIVAQPDPLELG